MSDKQFTTLFPAPLMLPAVCATTEATFNALRPPETVFLSHREKDSYQIARAVALLHFARRSARASAA